MIIPWIDGIKTIGLAPLTWLLILINLLFFLVTYQPAEEHKKINEQDLRWLYVMQHGSDDVPNDKDLLTAWQTLMSTNLVYEITDLKKQTHYPNPIEHEYRHQKILSIVSKIKTKFFFKFGFIPEKFTQFARWVTYQFIHGGWLHLVSNMIVLLIFGCYLEHRFGSSFLLANYLIAGIWGAYLYYLAAPTSTVPLIGASASISGIIGAYLILDKRKYVPFIYFLAIQYTGKIALPKIIILFIFFIDDLANFLGQSQILHEKTSYLAHLGGFFSGFLIGTFYNIRMSTIKKEQFHNQP